MLRDEILHSGSRNRGASRHILFQCNPGESQGNVAALEQRVRVNRPRLRPDTWTSGPVEQHLAAHAQKQSQLKSSDEKRFLFQGKTIHEIHCTPPVPAVAGPAMRAISLRRVRSKAQPPARKTT